MSKTGDKDYMLWLQFKNGDKDAFAAVYQVHIIPLIAYGSKICSDREVLKDSIHELFVELWHSRDKLALTDSVRFYLFKALRYKLIRQEKKRDQYIRAIPSITGLLYEDVEDAETAIVQREDEEFHVTLLQNAIKRLTTRQQEAIQLRYYQGFSNEQIADLMDTHYQSVSNLLYNALARLKEAVKTPEFIATGSIFFLMILSSFFR